MVKIAACARLITSSGLGLSFATWIQLFRSSLQSTSLHPRFFFGCCNFLRWSRRLLFARTYWQSTFLGEDKARKMRTANLDSLWSSKITESPTPSGLYVAKSRHPGPDDVWTTVRRTRHAPWTFRNSGSTFGGTWRRALAKPRRHPLEKQKTKDSVENGLLGKERVTE
jgi:hypothetical protein